MIMKPTRVVKTTLSSVAHVGTSTTMFLLLQATVVCLLLVHLDAKPHPSKFQDVLEAHRNRRDLGDVRSWRYTRHAIDVLKVDLNNNDLYFCRGDPFRGVQCPEEPFCSAWDQICDGDQICALEHRKECLERSEASFGRMDSRLCDGDENPKWCHWKYQAPVRCGEDFFLKPTKKKIRIHSPRYPDKYPGDFFCFWTVSVPEGHKLAVNFLRFETESNYDLVSLGTGYNRENSRSVIIFKHSGTKKPSPSEFDLNTNTIWLTFKSDDWENFKGFVIEFTDRERTEFGVMGESPFNKEPNRDCGGKILMDDTGETIVHSPGYPQVYDNNMECEWVVSIEEGLRIRIQFEAFDVEEEEDHLSVGNGVSSKRAPILYKYSSRTKPTDIISRGSDVWFKFVTSIAVARTGFKAVLTEQPINDCGGIFTVPSIGKMSFGSPDFPNSYPGLDDCLWQFRSASDRRIHIGFTEFDTEYGYDVLRIGNGFEPNVNLTNVEVEASGGSLPGGGAGNLAFQSSGPVAWLDFKSDDYNQLKGFRFNVYSEESSPWIVEESIPDIEPTPEIVVDEVLVDDSDIELPDLQLQDQEIDDPYVDQVDGQDVTNEDHGTEEGDKKPKQPSTDQTEPQEPLEPQPDEQENTQIATDPTEGQDVTNKLPEEGGMKPSKPSTDNTEPLPHEPQDPREPPERETQPDKEPPRRGKKPKKNKKNPTTEAPTSTTEELTTTHKATTTMATTEEVIITEEESQSSDADGSSSSYDSGFSTSSSQ